LRIFRFSARLQAFTVVPGWASARLLPEQRRRLPLADRQSARRWTRRHLSAQRRASIKATQDDQNCSCEAVSSHLKINDALNLMDPPPQPRRARDGSGSSTEFDAVPWEV
jgi:hypothetical protein